MKKLIIIALILVITCLPTHAERLKARTQQFETRTKKLAISHHRMWKELRRLHEELNQIKKKLAGESDCNVNLTPLAQEA